jgi:hypothetical protein
MFKRTIALMVIVLMTITLNTICQAGTFEFQAKQVGENEVWKYTSTAGFGEKLSSQWGWTGFVLSSNTWGEAYVGPTYSPANWITVAACIGVEDSAQKSRFATWYSLTHGQWSLFHVMEDGGTGRWHKLLAMYSNDFGRFGYWDQAGLGRGPRVEIKMPGSKTRASVYVSVLWNEDVTNQAVGLIKSF